MNWGRVDGQHIAKGPPKYQSFSVPGGRRGRPANSVSDHMIVLQSVGGASWAAFCIRSSRAASITGHVVVSNSIGACTSGHMSILPQLAGGIQRFLNLQVGHGARPAMVSPMRTGSGSASWHGVVNAGGLAGALGIASGLATSRRAAWSTREERPGQLASGLNPNGLNQNVCDDVGA